MSATTPGPDGRGAPAAVLAAARRPEAAGVASTGDSDLSDIALLAAGDDVFRRLAASAPVGLVVVTTEGAIRLANSEAARILGGAWRLPEPLRAALAADPAAGGGGPVVLERAATRLEVRCQMVDAPWLAPLRVAWLTDVTRAGVVARRLAAIATASATVADVGNLSATLDVVAAEVVRADDIAAAQIITFDGSGLRVRVLGTAGFTDTTDFVPLLMRCQRLGAELVMLECRATSRSWSSRIARK
jgi:hypothetical protein